MYISQFILNGGIFSGSAFFKKILDERYKEGDWSELIHCVSESWLQLKSLVIQGKAD